MLSSARRCLGRRLGTCGIRGLGGSCAEFASDCAPFEGTTSGLSAKEPKGAAERPPQDARSLLEAGDKELRAARRWYPISARSRSHATFGAETLPRVAGSDASSSSSHPRRSGSQCSCRWARLSSRATVALAPPPAHLVRDEEQSARIDAGAPGRFARRRARAMVDLSHTHPPCVRTRGAMRTCAYVRMRASLSLELDSDLNLDFKALFKNDRRRVFFRGEPQHRRRTLPVVTSTMTRGPRASAGGRSPSKEEGGGFGSTSQSSLGRRPSRDSS